MIGLADYATGLSLSFSLILLVADHRRGVARGDGVCDLHRRLERGLDQRGRFGDQPTIDRDFTRFGMR